MSTKKENVIGTRVSDKLLAHLSEYAEKENIKLSKLVRDSLLYYDLFVIEQEKIEVPIFIFAKNEYAAIIEQLDHEGLEKVAEVCFKNTMASFKYHRDNIKDKTNAQIEIPMRNFLKALKERVLFKNRQNWFDNLAIKIEKHSVLIAGLHNVNHQFSIFLKLYFLKVMQYYEHDLTGEDLLPDKIILRFSKIL